MNMNKKTILVMTAAMLSLASCSIIRGYRADGKSGPDIYSFEHYVHDTIDNGTFPFRFPYAKQQAIWIDTLHFFNQGKHYKNTTLQEAVTGKTDTQGVLVIQNDSIIYEKYWGDISADRMSTVFSVANLLLFLSFCAALTRDLHKSIYFQDRSAIL